MSVVPPDQVSAQPLPDETASLIGKETIEKRISNNEYRMSNVEVRNPIDFYRFKRQSGAILPFEILRFAVQFGRRLPKWPV